MSLTESSPTIPTASKLRLNTNRGERVRIEGRVASQEPIARLERKEASTMEVEVIDPPTKGMNACDQLCTNIEHPAPRKMRVQVNHDISLESHVLHEGSIGSDFGQGRNLEPGELGLNLRHFP